MKFIFAVLALFVASSGRAGTLGSVDFAVPAPLVVERLHNVGGLIYDRNGNQVQLRGFNTSNDSATYEDVDGNELHKIGGTVVRWTPAWYHDVSKTCDPSKSATFTGSISSSTLTISSGAPATAIQTGTVLNGSLVFPTTQIVSGSGTSYTVSPPQFIGSTTISTSCIWPQTGDAFETPNNGGNIANGFFDLGVLKATDDQVAAAAARHIWFILGFTTGGGDFVTKNETYWNNGANLNTTVQGYYKAMLQFMARRYMNTPYIACYELWTEPTPFTADTNSTFNNNIVAAIEIQAIEWIREVDQVTPICIGPASAYDVRANYNMTAAFAPVIGSNVWSMNNWYELTRYVKQVETILIGSGCPCVPPVKGANFNASISGTTLTVSGSVTGTIVVGTVVKGAGVTDHTTINGGTGPSYTVDTGPQAVPLEPMFTGYTTYPDVYYDEKPSRFMPDTPPCLYPPHFSPLSLPVNMTGGNSVGSTSFLAGLDDYCAVAWTNATGVPIVVDQVGLPTWTPGAWQYDADQLDMMNTRHQSYVIWVLRTLTHKGTPIDSKNGGSSGGHGLYYEDLNGAPQIKGMSYNCPPTGQGNSNYLTMPSISTCDDYETMFTSKFGAAP